MWIGDSLLSLGLLVVAGLVITSFVSGAENSTNTTTNEEPPLITDAGQDEGSGAVEGGGLFNGTEPAESTTNATDVLPQVVITNADGNPCLLATINASLRISFKVSGGNLHETSVTTSPIESPEGVITEGVCNGNSSNLIISWDNGTIQLNMTFTKMSPEEKVNNWTVSSILVMSNLSNIDMFPGALESDVITVESDKLTLFSTEIGVTKECNHDFTIFMGSQDHRVDVTFHDVEIAAFNLSSTEFPKEVAYCIEKDSLRMHDDILVPLIVACCLSLIVIVVVVAYAISRKVQEAREQTQYKPMP